MADTRSHRAPPLVTIGASTGGVEALRLLCSLLPVDFPAAVLIVLHVDSHPSVLPRILARSGPLPAAHALHGEPLYAGRIYVAPPDHHMLVNDHYVVLETGPKEHHTRPAIDPLFRSAARYHGQRVAGVVLTGDLNDGAQGLWVIRQGGGLAIAQDPYEAIAPVMPQSALQQGGAEVRALLADIPGLLRDWCDSLEELPVMTAEAASTQAVPGSLDVLPERTTPDVHAHDADRTIFVCPSCKGSLIRTGEPTYDFVCYVGHRFTLESLALAQNQSTDEALWSAYRALCEQSFLLALLAEEAHAAGRTGEVEDYKRRTGEAERLAIMALGIAKRRSGPAPD